MALLLQKTLFVTRENGLVFSMEFPLWRVAAENGGFRNNRSLTRYNNSICNWCICVHICENIANFCTDFDFIRMFSLNAHLNPNWWVKFNIPSLCASCWLKSSLKCLVSHSCKFSVSKALYLEVLLVYYRFGLVINEQRFKIDASSSTRKLVVNEMTHQV